jgi:membrane fusion protein (multidrug efflux system)
VPQQSAGQIPVGRAVKITTDDAGGSEWSGRVTALDSMVDEATRNIRVQATLPNADGRLRPGMFVQAEVAVAQSQSVIVLPASSINYAPYGDSVFVVADLKGEDGKSYRGVRQQLVKVGPARGDQVSVLSGLKPGEEVVTSGLFKLRNGAAVQINNEVRPDNNAAPKPGNS